MTQILNYLAVRWPTLIIIALYAAPVFAYRFLVAPKYEYPKRLLGFAVLFILLYCSLIVISQKQMILWLSGHIVVLLIHDFIWLRNIIQKRPIGSPEAGYVTVALAFSLQIIPFIHFCIALSAG